MATKKFSGPSPYKLTKTYPAEDYLHTDYVNNVTARDASKIVSAPRVAAIFGLGRAGSIHLTSLVNNPRVILKYIVDDRVNRFADLRKYWNLSDDVVLIPSNEAQKVYKDKSVTLVFIASPTWTHHDIVVNSIANGKDVFCEKPIAENIEETKKCYEAAKAKGRVLFSAFNRRFDPAYRALKDRVRKGEVGHVQIMKVTARDSPLPSIDYLKTSGGVFHDCLVHDIDMACWILGELPCRVQASATALVPEIKAIDDFDTIAFLLTFPSGTVVLGDNSRFSAYGYDQRLEVFGNKGMIKVENERPYHSTEAFIGQEGVKLSPIYYSFPSRYKAGYQRELEHFLDVVNGGCKHSLLLLFWLVKKSSEPSSTAVECYWIKPTLSSANTEPVLSKEIFSKAKVPKLMPKCSKKLSEFQEECGRRELSNSLILKFVDGQKSNSMNIFDIMLAFIDQEAVHDYSNFIKYLGNIINDSIIKEISSKTVGQAESKYWHSIRQGRLTASKLHEAAHCSTDGALVEQILGGYKVPETKAIQRGKRLESRVLQALEGKLNLKIEKSGFHLINGILGASPDGICEDFVVEVKCPASERSVKTYIRNDEIVEKFKTQIMCQMLACKKKKGIFCVADPLFETTKNIHVIWVDYDDAYIMNMIQQAEDFWSKFIFPKLLTSAKK